MATWDDVRRIAGDLPDVTERSRRDGMTQWRVRDKLFVWERPLRRTDLVALGDDAPQGAILAARVPDLGVKDALIADQPDVFFTIPHFEGYHAVLARLEVMRAVGAGGAGHRSMAVSRTGEARHGLPRQQRGAAEQLAPAQRASS